MARILVIKHGALGDIFQAFGVFATLRHAFPNAHLTLLTRPVYEELARLSPWFDDVLLDDRLPLTSLKSWKQFRKLHHQFKRFDHVFDFQNAQRTQVYFHLMRLTAHLCPNYSQPTWSGQVKGASHRHKNPQCRSMHTLSRQEDQLRAAGLTSLPRPYPDWLAHRGPHLPEPYVVIVPGAARHRPRKCWPVERFADLVPLFRQWGLRSVITGDKCQKALGTSITAQHPHVHDFTGRTSLPELAGLINRAALIIGNDTGPLHIAAAMDRPCLTLFSSESDPRHTAPVALSPHRSRVLAATDLAQLSSKEVAHFLTEWALPQIPITPVASLPEN